ncbi:hypothetical protein AAMO2058_000796300 [Amorphochlora amoebiformis]
MAPKKGRGGTKSKRKRSNGNKGARGRSSKDKPVERPAIADKRFEHVHHDPMFQRMPKKRRTKAEEDMRFAMEGKDFSMEGGSHDRYGRSAAVMRRIARGDDEGEGEDEDSFEEADGEDSDTSSSSDDFDALNEEAEILEPLEEEVPVGDATKRLAVMHLDWDHVKAVDLLVLFQSFLPPGHLIHRCSVYKSQFGKERMEKEAKEGPSSLWESAKKIKGGNEEKISEVALRQYERDRLRYYYGVVACDSVSAARHLYRECDGVDFGQSGNAIDLRYIPDDMTFEKPDLRDMANEVPDDYEAPGFFTRALSHTKVELSWDREDPSRTSAVKGVRDFKGKGLKKERDLQVYLASDVESDGEGTDFALSVSDSEAEEGKVVLKRRARNKYKNLLSGIEDDVGLGGAGNDPMEGEIIFETGLRDAGEELLKKVQKKTASKEESAFARSVRERKEKRQEKLSKRQAESQLEEEEDDGIMDAHLMNDPFFSEAAAVKREKNRENREKRKNKIGKKIAKDKSAENLKKQAEMDLLVMDEEEEGGKGYSLTELEAAYAKEHEKGKGKKSQKKKKKIEASKVEDKFEVNVKDDRFEGLYSNPDFFIDPTSPHFKKTKGTATIMDERRRRFIDETDAKRSKVKEKSKNSSNNTAAVGGAVRTSKKKGPRNASLMRMMGRVKASTARLKAKSKANSKKMKMSKLKQRKQQKGPSSES